MARETAGAHPKRAEDAAPGGAFSRGTLRVKRVFDLAVASFLLILLAPVLLLTAAAVAVLDGRPILFKQVRVGLNGRHFTLYKFRTMVVGAEKAQRRLLSLSDVSGPVFKIRRDPRVTRLGLLLRFFSVDELPQLFNVLKGEMSLVGPRPPLPEEVAQYESWQRRRLAVPPGMTCTWQASGRSAIPFEQWVRMDLAYIDTWSFWQDVLLVLRTIPAVLFPRGAW